MKLLRLLHEAKLTRDELEADNYLIVEITTSKNLKANYVITDVPPTITDVQFAQLIKTSFEPGSISGYIDIDPVNLTNDKARDYWLSKNHWRLTYNKQTMKWKKFVATVKEWFPYKEEDDFDE